ncbi:alpha/beta fold hydrolase [Brevibacillus migulae]|uniref:alpha/beta fold hydrolase n=1 Tax=Brevibacillus migulae TaxID=1644114 RepID=UPI00106E359F|nr:alpha/beta hydrolase [Brevibacillus migulae]
MECKLNQITVHFEVYGTGTPMLLLHGFSCDLRLMTGCMEPIFAEREGWQRIYLDLPGMGQSKGEDWLDCSDDMLSVVEQFVDKVLPGQPFAVAGESYGGYLSRGLLARRPEQVEGMLLICPVGNPDSRDLPPFTVLVKDEAFLADLQHPQIEEFTTMHVVQDRYNWERFAAEILSGVSIADQRVLDRIRQRYGLSFIPEELIAIYEKPVLILTGRQDHIVGYQDQWKLMKTYSRASYAVLDRAGHNLQIEQNQLFNVLVNEWLNRVEEHRSLR